MSAEEEDGFSVVDKRRAKDEAQQSPSEAVPDEESSQAPPQPEQEQDIRREALPKLKVRDRLLMCFDILHQGAWISLGLVADPSTGQVEQNLDEAKTAIDCAAFLVGKLESLIDESTLREIRRVLSDLQVNFVRLKQQ